MNERECETCIKRKTMYCPNSSECFETKDKIYYQNRIMALEGNEELVEKNLKLQNNWNELKKWLEEQKEFINDIPTFSNDIKNNHIGMVGAYNNSLDKMQELDGNNE